jgi:predicted PurR-regulated permease PerM
MEKRQAFEISWTTLWRIFIFVVFVAVLFLGRQIVLGLFLAIVISSGLEDVVSWLERIGLPRSISVILIFLAAILAIILVVYMVLPLAIVELNTILGVAGKTGGGLGFLASFSGVKTVNGFVNQLSSQIFSSNATPLNFFSSALGGFGLAFAVIISSFYLCLSRDGVERFLKVVTPPDSEAAVLRIYERSRQKMGAWFRMQLLSSVAMGFIVWGGLTLLNVKYAFFIGIIAAIFEIVPFIGPILSGALAVVSALATSTVLAVYTLIFFLIAQQFESNVLVPLLNRRSVGLHPVIVITAVLIGAEVGGILGIIISIPAVAVFQEVITDWSVKKRSAVKDQ